MPVVNPMAADADNLLVLKQLLEDSHMNPYLLQTIIPQGGKDFDETALPPHLQSFLMGLCQKLRPYTKIF